VLTTVPSGASACTIHPSSSDRPASKADSCGNRRRLRPSLAARSIAVLAALALATGVAVEGSAPAAATASNPQASALRYALSKLGSRYSYGSAGPSSFDCSGLTMASYASAGVAIPRISRDQYAALPKVRRSISRPGDLFFWASNTSSPSTIYHVGIYVGGNMVLAAPHTGTVVQIQAVWTSGLMAYAARPSAASSAALLPVEPRSVGDDVADVQMRLRATGYLLKVDGQFGPDTLASVKRIQYRMNAAQTGTVDPATWAFMVTRGVLTRVA